MDVSNNSTANGAEVIQWQDTGGANQQWRFEPNADGSYSIVNVNSGKYLDVYNGNQERATRLIQWEKNGGDNQKFVLEQGTEYQTENSSTNNQIIEFPQDLKVGETMRIPIGNAKYIENAHGELILISDLINAQETPLSMPLNSINARATNSSTIVDTRNVAYPLAAINLHVTYGTSGNYNMGRITHHNAYTSFTGYTLNFDWIEKQCTSRIVGTKDIYAFASGEVIHRAWVPAGYIEYYRQSVQLSGYAFVIR